MTERAVGAAEDLSEAVVSVVVERVEAPVELASMTVVVSASGVVELRASVPVVSSLSVVTGPVVSQSAEEEPEEVVISWEEVSVTVTVESSPRKVLEEVDPSVEGSEEMTRASGVVKEVEESWVEEEEVGELVSMVVLVLTVTLLVSVAVEDDSNTVVLRDEEGSVEVRSVVDVVSVAPVNVKDDERVVEGSVEDRKVDGEAEVDV